MVQTRKPQRLLQIVEGATQVFARLGYKRTLMADIAAEAGVALGTLYRYAETKEDLFELALRAGFGHPVEGIWHAVEGDGFTDSVFAFVQAELAAAHFPSLDSALAVRQIPPDATSEFQAIMAEGYDFVARYRVGLRLLDRSTHEWPELAMLFVNGIRAPFVDHLIRYLETRTAAGALRRPPHLPTAARTLVEIVSALAMHRYHTPGGTYATDDEARATALDLITAAFRPASTEKG